MSDSWDPQVYARYTDERSRPFHDLVQRVPVRPRHVVDLGCGDGSLTRTLLERWPEAEVLGVDRSPEMLAAAKAHAGFPRLRFEQADLSRWSPETPPDLIVSNAALHWVPDHASVLAHLVSSLAPNGVLAVQVPMNQDAPSHRIVREVAGRPGYSGRFVGMHDQAVLPPADYVRLLRDLDCTIDLWTTTYHHVLPEPDGVLRWLEGTTLRPYLHRLGDDEEVRCFLSELSLALRAAYPPHDGQVVFPFTRLFFVAHRHT